MTQHVTPHSTTGVPPAELLMKRQLTTTLDRIRPNLSEKVKEKQEKQKQYHGQSAKQRQFQIGDFVHAKHYGTSKPWIEAIVGKAEGRPVRSCTSLNL